MQQVVTQQAVDAAADAIVAAGGKPTFRLIQQRVGGSFTTLKPMLACWRRSKFDPPCRLNFDPGLGAGIG